MKYQEILDRVNKMCSQFERVEPEDEFVVSFIDVDDPTFMSDIVPDAVHQLERLLLGGKYTQVSNTCVVEEDGKVTIKVQARK